jgi:hypothetical protein
MIKHQNKIREYRYGLTVWQTPNNKFNVIRLGYLIPVDDEEETPDDQFVAQYDTERDATDLVKMIIQGFDKKAELFKEYQKQNDILNR